jgi:flagellar basal body-associated protein FliL
VNTGALKLTKMIYSFGEGRMNINIDKVRIVQLFIIIGSILLIIVGIGIVIWIISDNAYGQPNTNNEITSLNETSSDIIIDPWRK